VRLLKRTALLAFALTASAGIAVALVFLLAPSHPASRTATAHPNRSPNAARHHVSPKGHAYPIPIPNAPLPCRCAKPLPPFHGALRPAIVGGTGIWEGRLYVGSSLSRAR
jgi:hypothetical protein